jgi:hypothetical protein
MNDLGDRLRAFRKAFSPRKVTPQRVKNRWNSIGRTRRRLAEILTLALAEIEPERWAPVGGLRVRPEEIYAMRLAGKARIWEDAHSWKASAVSGDGETVMMHIFSYDNMTAIVRAGAVDWIGKDGECCAKGAQPMPVKGQRWRCIARGAHSGRIAIVTAATSETIEYRYEVAMRRVRPGDACWGTRPYVQTRRLPLAKFAKRFERVSDPTTGTR